MIYMMGIYLKGRWPESQRSPSIERRESPGSIQSCYHGVPHIRKFERKTIISFNIGDFPVEISTPLAVLMITY